MPFHYADPEGLAKDLTGKVFIVTGGNSGIGFEAVKQFASQGATVVLACRRIAEGEKCADEVNARGVGKVVPMTLDLASLKSVRLFAEAFQAKFDRLDVLLNNGGIMMPDFFRTKEGFEGQFGTNHMGHFALTKHLLPLLLKSPEPRVVNVASAAAEDKPGKPVLIDWDDVNYEKKEYAPYAAYGQSKLANVLHAQELARRYGDKGLFAASLHPGFVKTNLLQHKLGSAGPYVRPVLDIVLAPVFFGMGAVSPRDGTQATFHCTLSDAARKSGNGLYFAQGSSPRPKKGGFPCPLVNEFVDSSPDAAKKLWELSESYLERAEKE